MSLKSILHNIEKYSKSPSKERKHARRLARLLKKKTLLLACIFALYSSNMAYALPEGGNVVAGQANIAQQGNTMTVNQSTQNAIINWNSFSIAQKEAFIHNMPSAQAAALHRVIGSGSSDLAGLLRSNANIYLVNPNGITIHQGAQIQTGGFVATTNDIKDADFMAGRYIFDQAGKEGAQVINKGNITVADAGFAILVAPTVRNDGVIAGRLAKVVLASGESFVLDLHGDELIQFKVDEKTVDSLYTVKGEQVGVENTGTIKSEGGVVVMTAAQLDNIVINSVNNTGVVMADSATSQGGKIIFGASGNITNTGTVTASSSVSDGGTISMIASNEANIGGKVEATGKNVGGRVDITAIEKVKVENATIEAKGSTDGLIRIGGEFQGGKDLGGVTAEQKEGYVGRFDDAPALASTKELIIDEDSTIDAGSDGTVIAWSDGATKVNGTWTTKYLETSGKYLGVDEDIDVKANGLWLLDPADVTISTAANSGGSQADWTNFNATWVQNYLNNTGPLSIVATDSITVNEDINWLTNKFTLEASDIIANASLEGVSLDIIAYNNLTMNNDASITINSASTLYVANDLIMNNTSKLHFNAYNPNLSNVDMNDSSSILITKGGSFGNGDRIELQNLNMERNTVFEFDDPTASATEFIINNSHGATINSRGTIKAGDNDTISFGINDLTLILGGRNSTKAGHVFQAGTVIMRSGTAELSPYSIYAKTVDLTAASVTGVNNTTAKPGITIEGDEPSTPQNYGSNVVVKYVQPSQEEQKQEEQKQEEQKILDIINDLDRENLEEQIEYLQNLLSHLTLEQRNILFLLTPKELELALQLSTDDLMKLLELPYKNASKLLGIDGFLNQIEDLLELPLHQIIAFTSLTDTELQMFINLPSKDWNRVINMELSLSQLQRLSAFSGDAFENMLTLSDTQLNDLLILDDGYYSVALSLSFDELVTVLSYKPDMQRNLLHLNQEHRSMFLNLPTETIEKLIAFEFGVTDIRNLLNLPVALRDEIIDTWFSAEQLKNLIALPENSIDYVLNFPAKDLADLADLSRLLNLPVHELENAITIAYLLSGTHIKEILSLSVEQREKFIQLSGSLSDVDIANLVSLEGARRDFALKMAPEHTSLIPLLRLGNKEFDNLIAMPSVVAEELLSYQFPGTQLNNFLNMSTLAQEFIMANSDQLLPSYTRKITNLSSEQIHTIMFTKMPVQYIWKIIDMTPEQREKAFNVQIDNEQVNNFQAIINRFPPNLNELSSNEIGQMLADAGFSGYMSAALADINSEYTQGDYGKSIFMDLPPSKWVDLAIEKLNELLVAEWQSTLFTNVQLAQVEIQDETISIQLQNTVNYVPPKISSIRVNNPSPDEEKEFYSHMQRMVDQMTATFNGEFRSDTLTFDEWKESMIRQFDLGTGFIIMLGNKGLDFLNIITGKDFEITDPRFSLVLQGLSEYLSRKVASNIGTKID